MKRILLLAIVLFGMAYAVGTPTSYDDYDDYYYDDYYYDDDYSFDYGYGDSTCCCTGFILPLGMLFAGVGYTYYNKKQ
jgi:hypothetical protein